VAKRNRVTTNAARQMQRATPHQRWQSCAAHQDWQRAVKWFGADHQATDAALRAGLRPRSILLQLRDQAVIAARQTRMERLLQKATRRPRQTGRVPLLAGLTALVTLTALGLGVQP
jgi:hypothetical protein